MDEVTRLPTRSEVFTDLRSKDRALRVTHHVDEGVIVLSVWHDHTCAASFRLPIEDAPRLVGLLSAGLGDQLGEVRRSAAAADSTGLGDQLGEVRRPAAAADSAG